MTEIIEGTATEVEPIRALVVQQPGQAIVSEASATGPKDMIERATVLAGALRDIVERQRLFTVISGKKYPQVEAWMTIARMDNVVARESARPIRNDDGSYEAFVELVRLSDGMVIGAGSALCGTSDDRPWNNRSEPARRSMAVTRATSRAFRQQYSWIMALAGYEATPADEMPDSNGETHQPRGDEGQIGIASLGKIAPVDGQLRQTPGGMSVGFVIGEGREKVQAVATGPQAEVLATILPTLIGRRVQAYGAISSEHMLIRGNKVPFLRVALTKLVTPDETIDLTAPLSVPFVDATDNTATGHEHLDPGPIEAEAMPAFDMAELDRETGAA